MPETSPNPFVSDSPVTDPLLDRFNRHPFATRVARTLASRTDSSSLVLAIHGEWGEGKTTVLEFIYADLCRFEHVIPIRFNPWRVADESSLIRAFFETLATALDRSIKTAAQRIGDVIRKYAGTVQLLKVKVSEVEVAPGEGFWSA